jgi:hypothetical protein
MDATILRRFYSEKYKQLGIECLATFVTIITTREADEFKTEIWIQ